VNVNKGMSRYSIKELEHLSGIKAHTIRIWEQRYQLINPKRTETNIRYYDDHDLKLILNVSLLKDHSFKISKISQMSQLEMQNEVRKLTENSFRFPEQIHALTICMVDMDEDRFEKILSTNILKLGFEKTMLNIIYPFLDKIGMLWRIGAINPAQEHFISNLVRQKLIVAIDNQYVSSALKANKFLLYLPEGELHELSLLFADYIIRSRKNKSIYLGQSLPLTDMEEVAKYYQPDYIVTALTSSTLESIVISDYLEQLSMHFPKKQILVGGLQANGHGVSNLPHNVMIIESMTDFINFVEDHQL
jgi:DNA-binding transcriptional MerR regulator